MKNLLGFNFTVIYKIFEKELGIEITQDHSRHSFEKTIWKTEQF